MQGSSCVPTATPHVEPESAGRCASTARRSKSERSPDAVTRVEWSHEDGEYVATDERYPSLSWLDDSPEGAALGLDTLIRDIEEGRA